MTMRSCARILAAGVLAAASLLGSGGVPASGNSGVAVAPAAAMTTLPSIPELAIDHRLPAGGMNLWRMPISSREAGVGSPQLVRTLDYGGFSYDNSVVLAGDIGQVTPSDDGTPDYVIWHAQPNGGVLLWGVGGGGDTTPQLWADLRTGGWSFAQSRPMLGDVNGDGWDDLVVIHPNGPWAFNIWVFLSDGHRLGTPQLWAANIARGWWPNERDLLADMNGDGLADLVSTGPGMTPDSGVAINVLKSNGSSFQGGAFVFDGPASAGWSFSGSRQLAGDVNGDGLIDIVTVHAQAGGGMLVWVHTNCSDGTNFCLNPPVVWQNLKTGGWSFAGSRQYIADSDGDGFDDLISVHSQGGNPGELVWRALSTGSGFGTPEIVANLKTGGWNYLSSREKVASLYGQITF